MNDTKSYFRETAIKSHDRNLQLPCSFPILCSSIESCFLSKESSINIMNNIAKQLQYFGKEGVESYIKVIMRDDELLSQIAAVSYLQGNGFYKLVLESGKGFNIRLHIWLPGISAQEDLHDHRWYIASTIITGCLHTEIWRDSIAGHAHLYDEYMYSGKQSHPELVGKARVEFVETIIHNAGDAYVLEPHILHRIISNDRAMTMTLMCRPSSSRKCSRNISIKGEFSNVIPTYMSPDELYQLLKTVDLMLTAME